MSRKISYWNTEELGTDNKGNGRSIKKNEEAIQQEKEKPTRTKVLQYESVDRLWTRVRVRTLDNYQSTMDIGLGRHVTWKSCDRVQSGLEGLRV